MTIDDILQGQVIRMAPVELLLHFVLLALCLLIAASRQKETPQGENGVPWQRIAIEGVPLFALLEVVYWLFYWWVVN